MCKFADRAVAWVAAGELAHRSARRAAQRDPLPPRPRGQRVRHELGRVQHGEAQAAEAALLLGAQAVGQDQEGRRIVEEPPLDARARENLVHGVVAVQCEAAVATQHFWVVMFLMKVS